MTPVNNGAKAVEFSKDKNFDVVFLDEHMPGMSGLETLTQIKQNKPALPIIMITKSEEEHLMEDAIGSQIADYLIKPVNPNQILLSLKKITERKRLIDEKINTGYRQNFSQIGMAFNERLNFEQWVEVYKKLVFWEMEIQQTYDKSMAEVLAMQKEEANASFCKFISENYLNWLNRTNSGAPLMSHRVLSHEIFPFLQKEQPVFLFLIDNLRYDHWKALESIITELFSPEKESIYCSILPTATQYCRNALFSGLLPSEMASRFPDLWIDDDEETGKNLNEDKFLSNHLERNGIHVKFSYHKINNLQSGRNLSDNITNLLTNKLNVIVYNFIDKLSHAKTDIEMIRELAVDEAAYRALVTTWFLHSPLYEILKKLSEKDVRIFITSDHGSIRVKRAVKIIGDRNTNTNLRYKQGKNLNYAPEEVFTIKKPSEGHLPQLNISTTYVFAREDSFFAYPNNYNQYVNIYKNSFQHGGISMEEMMVPLIRLKAGR
ncbi:MAG: two-component system response regulator [Bacteroidetes bacterium RIFCSPLOWO2_02_FULL_36_8]|nr:MAG: two-component system response regulator [Bacteroidetes bacterium RIFCSPLOWO2_02_FULL_36_8]